MNVADLVTAAIAYLNDAGVPYMITGSFASSFHGVPRATRGLDIVIDPDPASLERLVNGLAQAGYYVDRDAAFAALRDRTQFNVIGDGAMKIDFMIRKARPFSVAEFGRRRAADVLGNTAYIATVEDMIIAKLEWAATTESERQLRDVGGMLDVAGGSIDREYIERWVESLALQAAWRRAEPQG